MRKHEPILAAALLGAGLLLAACGTAGAPNSGGGGTSGSNEPSSASPTPTKATPSEVSTSRPATSSKPSKLSKPPKPSKTVEGRIRGRCHTGQLAASVRMRDSAAGHRYAWLVLRNTSDMTCTIYGYGGMQLYSSGGRAVPTKMVRDRDVPPRLLSVAPGKTARSSLSWTVVPTGGEPSAKACEPSGTTAHVTPPDETTYLTTSWRFGQVCDHGTISQGAYRGTPTGAGS